MLYMYIQIGLYFNIYMCRCLSKLLFFHTPLIVILISLIVCVCMYLVVDVAERLVSRCYGAGKADPFTQKSRQVIPVPQTMWPGSSDRNCWKGGSVSSDD